MNKISATEQSYTDIHELWKELKEMTKNKPTKTNIVPYEYRDVFGVYGMTKREAELVVLFIGYNRKIEED